MGAKQQRHGDFGRKQIGLLIVPETNTHTHILSGGMSWRDGVHGHNCNVFSRVEVSALHFGSFKYCRYLLLSGAERQSIKTLKRSHAAARTSQDLFFSFRFGSFICGPLVYVRSIFIINYARRRCFSIPL